jgi:pantoate--beta-alanine ligase
MTVSIRRTASQIRETIAGWRAATDSIALVPTLGNLHAGHLSLARLAAEHVDRVILSIFVNPTQFGVGEDFEAYPRTLSADQALIEQEGSVDALFVPEITEIYPRGPAEAFGVRVPPIGGELCGAARPGHFDGVAGVVLRLINIVWPDLVVFGRKDYQQLLIIERMLADFRLPIGLIAGETERERDGLAISSRNQYLTAGERERAPELYASLKRVCERLAGGERDYARLERDALAELTAAGFRPDYVEVRRAADLGKPPAAAAADELIVLGAAWLGQARLIDNLDVIV